MLSLYLFLFTERMTCGYNFRIPSALNRNPAFDKDKFLDPMFGDVGQARTKAWKCRTANLYLHKNSVLEENYLTGAYAKFPSLGGDLWGGWF